MLKQVIREWRRNSFDTLEAKLKQIRDQLEKVHDIFGSDPMNNQLHEEELELQASLNTWLAHEENQMRQKSWETWLQLGDRNTKFFYSVIKTQQAKNHITHLINEDGNPVTDSAAIKVEAPAYFEKLFNQRSYWNVFPELIVKRRLTNEASQWLSRNISNVEIQVTLFQMHPDIAPHPDGYNAFFFQQQ